MKKAKRLGRNRPLATLLSALVPALAQAQSLQSGATVLPVEMSMTAFLIIGALLLLSITLFFIFQTRFNLANKQLQDISSELGQTRQRLTETSQTLEQSEKDLKQTTDRYQNILFDAEVGMFQIDLKGKCTYINAALQELSGLYPKKALKEGFQSAIHPDDRNRFDQAWKVFIQGDEPFALRCRFRPAKGREVHVSCRAHKVFNTRKEVESFIGWVSDITPFHEEQLRTEAETARHVRFVEETIEGYYHLAPDTPIPLSGSADQMAEAIMEKMKLVTCNETFAVLNGTSAPSLKGKKINDLPGGCGPFKNNDSIKKLIASDYKLIDLESIRQDPRGNRLNLVHNVIGLVEDNQLVGIRGSQRNISQQRREQEELTSQSQFMHRILDALPADVHVKDTRCRYLYASQKLAERTGIPQEDWIGKTIFEILPATPRDHDKSAINVMKSGALSRKEHPYETRHKSGWMETIQIPLVSDEGLIEGVVGLSFEISARKALEEKALQHRRQLEQQLQHRSNDLQKSQAEYAQAATELSHANQKLGLHEAEVETRQHEFDEQISERKRTEELLRRNEAALLTHQKHLENQLATRLSELETETDKRKKWEELIDIKENELQKLEEAAASRNQHLKNEILRREQMETNLETHLEKLGRYRKELDTLKQAHEKEVLLLTETQRKEFGVEHTARRTTEKQLKKMEAQFKTAQERIQTLIEQHAAELEHETAERKLATEKLTHTSDELDELKQQFTTRIEQETKALKRELAQKQIREKALRIQEKDLAARIKELEKTLQLKITEGNQQVQAREGAEVQREEIEQKLEQLSHTQNQVIERETQKLSLNIAEIRLGEVKLRQKIGGLQQAKETLEHTLQDREDELAQATKKQAELSTTLSNTQAHLEKLEKDQSKLVAKETQSLQTELEKFKHAEDQLRQEDRELRKQTSELENTIATLSTKLEAETQHRKAVETRMKELQVAFDAGQDNVEALLAQQSHELTRQIEQHKQNEMTLKKTEASLKKQADTLQKTIDTRSAELAEARKAREEAERELAQVIERSSQSTQEIENQLAAIKKEHQEELQRIKDEQKPLRQKENYYRTLFQSSADAFLQIDPRSGQIRSANQAAAQLFGGGAETLLTGKTIDALSPKRQAGNRSSIEQAQSRLHNTLQTGHESFEWQFLKADQSPFHGLVSLSTIQVEDKQLILAVVNDITALKQQQIELKQNLDQARAANQLNSAAVDEVVQTVHTSLSAVLQSTMEIEKAENLTIEQKLDMVVVNRDCRSLIETMSHRRELSHVADGTERLEPTDCNLHRLVNDLDEQFSPRAETKKLFFAVSYAQYQSASNIPKLIEIDEQKVRKVLGILLSYALAHTDKGRLGLHASRNPGKGNDILVTFELAYTGKTQQDELLSKIFDSSVPSGHAEPEDMQYGLSLAQRYATMMGGGISLEYRQGDITALTIHFTGKKVATEILMDGKNEQRIGAA